MKVSQWLSDSFRRRSRRERWFMSVGVAVILAALVVTQLILPWSDRWAAREAAHAASRDQFIRLQSLVAGQKGVEQAVAYEKRADGGTDSRLSVGATPALAASTLQVLLRAYAELSSVQLDRVDVAGQPKADKPGLMAIPVTLQGEGDIYGLVAFLFRIQHGERLLVVDEMAVNTGLVRRDGDRVLVWSLRAHGLYPAQPSGGTP
jgi:Type II secretion system (T2SS), protein M subtype b